MQCNVTHARCNTSESSRSWWLSGITSSKSTVYRPRALCQLQRTPHCELSEWIVGCYIYGNIEVWTWDLRDVKVSVYVAALSAACWQQSGMQTAAVMNPRVHDDKIVTIETIDYRCFDCRHLDTTHECAIPMHGSIGQAMGNGCVMLKTQIKENELLLIFLMTLSSKSISSHLLLPLSSAFHLTRPPVE